MYNLPKWPQMLVYGPPIAPELALEIIRRTDGFFVHGYDGNDHAFNKRAYAICGRPSSDDYHNREIDWQARMAAVDAFKERWGCLDLGYIFNDWVSSCYVGGPHGWVHPNGKLLYHDNIGKWPSFEEVVEDWTAVATAFPTLRLHVALMSGESCEEGTELIVALNVENGMVAVLDTPPFETFGVTLAEVQAMRGEVDFTAALMRSISGQHDHPISLAQIAKWTEEIQNAHA